MRRETFTVRDCIVLVLFSLLLPSSHISIRGFLTSVLRPSPLNNSTPERSWMTLKCGLGLSFNSTHRPWVCCLSYVKQVLWERSCRIQRPRPSVKAPATTLTTQTMRMIGTTKTRILQRCRNCTWYLWATAFVHPKHRVIQPNSLAQPSAM